MTCAEEVREWLKALTPLVIGAFAGWIAYQQWRTASQQARTATHKLKLELYEKRYKVYTAVRDVFSKVIQEAKADVPDFAKFYAATVEAKFLFDADVTDYLESIPSRLAMLRALNVQLADPINLPVGPERTKAAQDEADLLKWFLAQSEELGKRFRPYLGFDEIK